MHGGSSYWALATVEAEIRRITVLGQPRQNVRKTLISINSWAWWRIPVILVTQEVQIGESQSRLTQV
jgi:hypothetical protein